MKEQTQWNFMMDYCKKRGLSPSNHKFWKDAEMAYWKQKGGSMKERIEALEKELAELKAQLAEKYEPKAGDYCIYGNGLIRNTSGEEIGYTAGGRTFDTLKKAEKARDIMVRHDIILKYVIDHAPDYTPDWTDWDETKWVIWYDCGDNKWYTEDFTAFNPLGGIAMPEWLAEKLVDDLNNNRIDGI